MAPRFILRVEENGALLYDRAAHAYNRCTAAESFLLVATREVGLEAATTLLARSLGEDASETASRLLDDGVMDGDGVFRGRVIELTGIAGAFGAPLVAHLGVTLACNFSCSHCYSSSGKRAPDELTLEEIRALIDELEEIGCQKLVLGGGEPFLRRELPDVVAHANTAGVDCYVHTNASLLKPAVLERLALSAPAGLSVSLDGPDPASNDGVRGAGTFEKALAGLSRLRAHYPPGFNISMTITPHNATHAARMVELAHQQGARVLLLRPTYPAGEALHDVDMVCDRETFARAIDAARLRAQELGMTLDAPHPHEQGVPSFDGYGCVASRIVLGITPTGDVTPCLNLPGELTSGNLRNAPLLEIWQRGQGFNRLRDIEPHAQCAGCAHYETCRGGCRVRSLFAGNGLEGPDTWCHYEPRPGVTSVPREKPTGKTLLRIMS